MNLKSKLEILADAAKYDASCASSGGKRSRQKGGIGNAEGVGICHSYAPDGRCISLLKILLTNFCIFDCQYCVNRISSDVPRARFRVDEVVNLTLDFYRRNYIEGLFLSSGIIQSSDYTMEQLIQVAKSLREQHLFSGYIHLKGVAGASKELLEKAALYADRVSVNIELPTQEDLNQLAPEKTIQSTETSMEQLESKIKESKEERKKSSRAPRYAPAGQSTQMIVGATPSTDHSLLTTSLHLYQKYHLRRVYYSAYSPIQFADSRLPALSPPLMREHRLYQADWLFRFYGFKINEIFEKKEKNLDLQKDPKLHWALKNRSFFPVNLQTADRFALLRVPGLGIQSVDKVLKIRRYKKIRLKDLEYLRISLKKVKYFVQVADYNPDIFKIDQIDLESRILNPSKQLNLFDSNSLLIRKDFSISAAWGEL